MRLPSTLVLVLFGCFTSYLQGQSLITTVAGGAPFVFQEGPAALAPLGEVTSVAVDASGNVYAADRSNRIVVRITQNISLKVVFTLGPAPAADLGVARVAVDNSGNLYILESVTGSPPRITKLDAVTGQTSTIIQGGLADPTGLAVDPNGNLYVSEARNDLVQRIAPDGTITTIAGNGTCGSSGEGGPAVLAQLCTPSGVAVDQTGNVYIADWGTSRVLLVTPDGTITRIAGNGERGDTGDGGQALQAKIEPSGGIAVDKYGTVLFTQSHRIRYFFPQTGLISTFVGSTEPNFAGDGGGSLTAVRFRSPQGLAAISPANVYGNIYIADTGNWRVRAIFGKVGMLYDIPGTIAGNGAYGVSGDGGPGTAAALNRPYGLVFDQNGNLYYSDIDSHRVRKIDTSGIITTFAGAGRGFAGDGGPATKALLSSPSDLAFDVAGNLYILDSANGRVRRVGTDGIIQTVAGGGPPAATGDGIPAISAYLAFPSGMSVDGSGNIFIVESGITGGNPFGSIGRVRKVTPDGLISTAVNGLSSPGKVAVAANGDLYVTSTNYSPTGSFQSAGVLRIATDGTKSGVFGTPLSSIQGVTLGATANLYTSLFVSESSSEQVVRVDNPGGPSQSQTVVVAGSGTRGFSGDGGPGTSAMLDSPIGLAYLPGTGLYIADSGNKRIRRVTDCPVVPQLAPASISVSASAGTGGFEVTTAEGCGWSAQTSADWIILTTNSGSGYGSVFFSFIDNPQSTARTGSISVSGSAFQVTQDAAGLSTGTFEPQLVQHLLPGFYIVEATLAQGASGGFWGLGVLGETSGGFSLGGGLSAKAANPGFGAFYLPTPQTVSAMAATPLAPDANITLRLIDSNHQPVVPYMVSGRGPSSFRTALLQPGFYIVEITTDYPAPLNYYLGLSADFFSGGLDVGGYIGPGITGFGAFYLPVEQDVSMRMFGRNTYGAAGAGSLVLTLRDADRNVIQQVGP